MEVYVAEIRKLENKFSGLEIHHVDRNNNVGADVLSKLGSTRANVPPGVFVHELHQPSVKIPNHPTTDKEALATIREVLMIEEDWHTPSLTSSKNSSSQPVLIQKALKLRESSDGAKVSF